MHEPFRTVLLYGFIVLVAVMLPFRIRSQRTREPLDRRQEGWFILLTLRPAALAAFVGFISYLVNPDSMAWSFVPLPRAMRWMGVALFGLGIAFLVWTLMSLGKNLTDTVVTRRAAALVTHGPYRYVRHPFYGCMTLIFLGSSLVAANWFIAIFFVVVVALLARRTDREEALLVERFGDAYRDYMSRTGRFLPTVPRR